MKPTTIFSYFGGKGRLAHLYPPPAHKKIIEPFAGAAAYSWRYHTHDVHVNDLNPNTHAIWHFLLGPDALRWVKTMPQSVRAGERLSKYLSCEMPRGYILLLRSTAMQGDFGRRGQTDCKITSMAARRWGIQRRKLFYIIPRIQHWTASCLPYDRLKNENATWFVDPPYDNKAGRSYAHSEIDYSKLAVWCRSRSGQVIVCENVGADWLPFSVLTRVRRGVRANPNKRSGGEAVWINS